ncbi:MAG: aminopeptidase P N-terminal domain-containing protein [Planctomycetota bacterium]
MTSAQDLHRQRRQRVLDALGDGLLLVATAPEQVRNGDVHYPFRAGSDFHYLTGFHEPEAVLAAWRTGRGKHRAELFVRPRDKEREIWDGRRVGVAAAPKRLGVDAAHASDVLWQKLPELLLPHARLFHRLDTDPRFDRRLFAAFAGNAARQRRANAPAHPIVQDPYPTIAFERLIKGAPEIGALQRAADVTAAGHVAAMRAAAPGLTEFQVQAEVEATFRRGGAPREGYSSIVASGANACILHYHENDRTLRAGDLLLLDAGAEVDMYTADITRTFPVSGRFTPAQRAVYAVVLRAQKAAIAAVKPGAPWSAPHKTAVRVLTRGLVGLGLLPHRPVARLIESEAYKRFYMHGTSHWLGLDVHDAGPYQEADGKPIRLRPGMVLTVEPGLYCDPRDRKVPKEYRGIGVRIEDDVLVTPRGPRVLTAAAPKEIAAVEAACAGATAGGGRAR